jgi:hypothetical protein
MLDIKEALFSRGYELQKKMEVPKGGLTLADIEAFVDEAGGENALRGFTTEAVWAIMMVITKDCSYCEYLSKKYNTEVIDFTFPVILPSP